MYSASKARRSLLRTALYAMFVATVVWLFLFVLGIYQYHFVGHPPGGIVWLTAHRLGWGKALVKASYVAGVGAAMVLMLGTIVVLFMFILTELIVLLTKGKHHG